MTREEAIEIARKIPVDGTLKEAVDAVLAIDRAAKEKCANKIRDHRHRCGHCLTHAHMGCLVALEQEIRATMCEGEK